MAILWGECLVSDEFRKISVGLRKKFQGNLKSKGLNCFERKVKAFDPVLRKKTVRENGQQRSEVDFNENGKKLKLC